VPKSSICLCGLALIGTLAGCETFGPRAALPAGVVRLAPPAEYHTWWEATEACSGESQRFERVEWYVVPGARTFSTSDGLKVGEWSHSSAGVQIVLADAYADNELVVRHEMLHALLDREGHPAEYFEGRCRLTWESWGHRE
jgi:hypothetical protein